MKRQPTGIPFLLSVTVVLTTGKSGCETRELRFALGVTRQLLFLGISVGVKQGNYCQRHSCDRKCSVKYGNDDSCRYLKKHEKCDRIKI